MTDSSIIKLHFRVLCVIQPFLSSQATYIYIIKIVSKQLYSDNRKLKYRLFWLYSSSRI